MTKALQSFVTCVLAYNHLCRKLIPSLELLTTFDKILKVTSLPSSLLRYHFHLLNSKLDNFMFKVLDWVFYIDIMSKVNCRTQSQCFNSSKWKIWKGFFGFFSIEKNCLFPFRSTFPIKLICCIAFGSVSSSCCWHKSIAITL